MEPEGKPYSGDNVKIHATDDLVAWIKPFPKPASLLYGGEEQEGKRRNGINCVYD